MLVTDVIVAKLRIKVGVLATRKTHHEENNTCQHGRDNHKKEQD